MMAQRIRLSRTPGWRLPPGAVSVARPSRWGNPYPICEHRNREQAVEQFRRLLNGVVRGTDLCEHAKATYNYPAEWEIRESLVGRDLACWCQPSESCHGDLFLAVAAGERVPRIPAPEVAERVTAQLAEEVSR